MKIITFDEIKNVVCDYAKYLEWIDYPLRNRDKFVLPTKSRITLQGSDYCNIMPCALPDENIFGVKVINRNEKRRESGSINLDSQIMLYSYDTCELKAIMDGNYITTVRTAAVAVHSIRNMAGDYSVVGMIGLGNIMNAIGEMWFPLIDKPIKIKLMKYKDQAEIFMKRFEKYSKIEFEICNAVEDVMKDSDLVISAVSYVENDFCSPDIYKQGCTVIPVHMRGFMECDKVFDNIIVSDLVRAKGFTYYDQMKKVTYTDDVLAGSAPAKENVEDRVLIYNLGLAITDLYYAAKIYELIDDNNEDILLGTRDKFYI